MGKTEEYYVLSPLNESNTEITLPMLDYFEELRDVFHNMLARSGEEMCCATFDQDYKIHIL